MACAAGQRHTQLEKPKSLKNRRGGRKLETSAPNSKNRKILHHPSQRSGEGERKNVHNARPGSEIRKRLYSYRWERTQEFGGHMRIREPGAIARKICFGGTGASKKDICRQGGTPEETSK